MTSTNSIQHKETPQYEAVNPLIVFPIVALSLLMITMDSTIVATALHALQVDLQTSVTWAGWTLTIYSFGFVVMLPLSAKLSTQFGHRRIFLSSIATFTVASLLCGLATNIYTLIAMRALQAIGGAGITPSATGIIVNHFHQSRDRFLGLFGSMFATGSMIGPIFGGLFVTYSTWHWIFFVNIPIGIAVFFLAMRFIPNAQPSDAEREKLDIRGMLFLAIGIITAMYAVTYLGEGTVYVNKTFFIALIIASIISFTLFFRHIQRVKLPFIKPRFIYGRGFGAVNLVNFVQAGMAIGGISLVPLYAVSRYGISELHSGTLLVGEGLASIVMSVIMSIYLRRTGYRLPIYVGSIMLVIAFVLLSLNPLFGISNFVWVFSTVLLIGFGLGLMSPASRNAGIQLAPEESANIAAIRSLGLQMGQIVSIAGATSIIAAANNPTQAHAFVYLGLAVVILGAVSVISGVPESRGKW